MFHAIVNALFPIPAKHHAIAPSFYSGLKTLFSNRRCRLHGHNQTAMDMMPQPSLLISKAPLKKVE